MGSTGKLEAYIYQGDWVGRQTVELKSGESATIEIHRESSTPRRVQGRVVTEQGGEPVPAADISIYSVDGETRDETHIKGDENGEFSQQVAANRIGVFARSPDGRFAGVKFADVSDEPLSVTLTPTTTYQGRWIDGDGHPMKNKMLQCCVVLEKNAAKKKPSGEQTLYFPLTLESTTDEAGHFEFQHMPVGMRINVRKAPGGTNDLGRLSIASSSSRTSPDHLMYCQMDKKARRQNRSRRDWRIACGIVGSAICGH